MAIELTSCQVKAKDEIEMFLADEHSNMLIVSSPAGCGKSFLLEHTLGDLKYINELRGVLGTNTFDKVHMGAMSNKAAQVIRGETFDSLYGLFPMPDFKTGKTYRKRKGGVGRSQTDAIIAIDEAGMLDTDGLKHMEELTHRSKIILTLDRYQLPPVGEAEAPIFDRGIHTVELETPVRQAEGSPLLELCTSLRDGVKNQYLAPLMESDQVHYIGDEEAAEFFRTMTTEDKVLTYTNDLAIRLNQVVRNYKGVDGFWKEGEVLVSNGIIKAGTTTLLKNEQKLTVTKVMDDVITNEWGMDCKGIVTTAGSFLVPLSTDALTQALNKAKRAKDWQTYYGIKESVPDLRGSWSSTVHKSQGSTYNNVFINLNNLKKAKYQDFNLFLRLLYVAVSRAKGKVLLYGNL